MRGSEILTQTENDGLLKKGHPRFNQKRVSTDCELRDSVGPASAAPAPSPFSVVVPRAGRRGGRPAGRPGADVTDDLKEFWREKNEERGRRAKSTCQKWVKSNFLSKWETVSGMYGGCTWKTGVDGPAGRGGGRWGASQQSSFCSTNNFLLASFQD